MPDHIISVGTYGKHRVKDPKTGKRIAAHKIGYSGATSAVLLDLFAEKAHDVSPRRARYHYIQIEAESTARRGYLILKLTDEELERVKRLTRYHHRSSVYLWRDNQWLAFPTNQEADFTPPTGAGPDFNPSGLRATSPSSGQKEAATRYIAVEKSQRYPNEKPWFWISGDTYPHRELLKR